MFKFWHAKFLFWTSYPFVVGAYLFRRRHHWQKILPRLWLTQGEVLEKDLDLYNGNEFFGRDFIADFAKARDETLATIKKQMIVTALIFLFLISNYLAIKVDINIAGFNLTIAPGIPEGLLLISNLLSCYTLILQGNCYALDSSIKVAIKKTIPEELQYLYLIRYFPHEQVGTYRPFNLPHILPIKIISQASSALMFIFLFLLALTAIIFIGCNIVLMFHYLWLNPQFGIWSYALFLYILACGICAFLYSILTRWRLPHTDYTVNDELELLEQVDPPRHTARLQEIYGDLNRDRLDMERRGYLKS